MRFFTYGALILILCACVVVTEDDWPMDDAEPATNTDYDGTGGAAAPEEKPADKEGVDNGGGSDNEPSSGGDSGTINEGADNENKETTEATQEEKPDNVNEDNEATEQPISENPENTEGEAGNEPSDESGLSSTTENIRGNEESQKETPDNVNNENDTNETTEQPMSENPEKNEGETGNQPSDESGQSSTTENVDIGAIKAPGEDEEEDTGDRKKGGSRRGGKSDDGKKDTATTGDEQATKPKCVDRLYSCTRSGDYCEHPRYSIGLKRNCPVTCNACTSIGDQEIGDNVGASRGSGGSKQLKPRESIDAGGLTRAHDEDDEVAENVMAEETSEKQPPSPLGTGGSISSSTCKDKAYSCARSKRFCNVPSMQAALHKNCPVTCGVGC